MITASEAKKATEDQVTKIAKEFLINEVEKAIVEACSVGLFRTRLDVPQDRCDCKRLGKAVEFLLTAEGYKAEFIYCDDGPIVECMITVDWSAAK